MSIIKMRAKLGSTMKIVMLVFAVAFLVGAFYSFGSKPQSNREQGFGVAAGPAVIAKVNGTEITRQQFMTELARNPGYSEQDVESQPYVQTSLLDSLVDQLLNTQAAQAEGIRPSREDVDAERQQIIDTVMSRRYPSKRQLKRAVVAAGSKEKVRRSIQGEPGFPADDALRQAVMLNQLQDKIKNAVQVTDAEVQQSFEEVHARHILVSFAKVTPPAGKKAADLTQQDRDALARAKDEKLLQQLKGGADFADLARRRSADPSAEEGGITGFFSAGDLDPDFESAVKQLKVGETSGVVKTRLGYHVILRLN